MRLLLGVIILFGLDIFSMSAQRKRKISSCLSAIFCCCKKKEEQKPLWKRSPDIQVPDPYSDEEDDPFKALLCDGNPFRYDSHKKINVTIQFTE